LGAVLSGSGHPNHHVDGSDHNFDVLRDDTTIAMARRWNASSTLVSLLLIGVGALEDSDDGRDLLEARPMATQATDERTTALGQSCTFPFEFEGSLADDCVEFNGQEWCVVANGQWAVCDPASPEQTSIQNGEPKPVVINEVVHAPDQISNDKDWIELKNMGDQDLDLTGYVVKDDKLDELGFVIGSTPLCKGRGRSIVPANGYLHLIRDAECGFSFGLASDEEVSLFDPEGILVDSVSWNKGDAPKGLSWGRLPDGTGEFTNTVPTPLQPNVEGSLPATTEGDCCARIQEELPTFFTDHPVVVIDTFGQELIKASRAKSHVCSCTCTGAFGCAATESKDVNSTAAVRVRGNSSARDHIKKSFAVEFQDEQGNAIDANWFGLSKDDDWVLYGPEPDVTFMRNFVTYHLGRESGEYAANTKFVEVFLNTDNSKKLDYDKHYHGLYVAMDRIERGSHRVNVTKLDPQVDPSGGYIFKYDNDNIDADDIVFRTKATDLEMVLVYPKGDGVWVEDLQPLISYVDDFEAALFADNFQDPVNGYVQYMDKAAFINYLLVVEISKNPDGYRGSTFIHKDSGGPLAMGPLWDYNEAFGICCGFPLRGWNPEEADSEERRERTIGPAGWRFDVCIEEDGPWCIDDPVDGMSQWYQRLWQDPAFRLATAERWQELRAGSFSNAAVSTFLSEQSQLIRVAAERDYERWPEKVQGPFAQEIQIMRNWIIQRMEWMDEELSKEF